MNHLSVELLHRSCAFVLKIANPLDTLRRLTMFLEERKIAVENLQLQRCKDGTANLIIHRNIEKDRIGRTVQLLEQMPGILQLRKLEER